MATVAGVDQLYLQDHRVRTWSPLTTTNADGAPIAYASNGMGGVTFQVTGTWGAGGALVIEGSNDGATYFTLNDQANVALTMSANALKTVRDQPLYVRPRVTGGDGTTSLTVVAALQKTAAMLG
jgi:hypothetical protein